MRQTTKDNEIFKILKSSQEIHDKIDLDQLINVDDENKIKKKISLSIKDHEI